MSATTLTNFYRYSIRKHPFPDVSQLGMAPALSKTAINYKESCVNEAQSHHSNPSLPSIDSVYTSRCLEKSSRHHQGPSPPLTHPGHTLLHLLPSVKRYKSLRTRTDRLKNSFFPAAHQTFERTSHNFLYTPSYDCNTTFYTLSFPSPPVYSMNGMLCLYSAQETILFTASQYM